MGINMDSMQALVAPGGRIANAASAHMRLKSAARHP